MPEVIIIDTKRPEVTKTISLTPEQQLNQECLLGRDERCCIVLADSLVSRVHGKIFYRNGNYYYTDLGSRNGSRLNNEIVKPNQDYLLNTSDTISLGYHLLWVKSTKLGEENSLKKKSLQPEEYMTLATIDPSSLTRWTKGDLTVRCVQITEETDDVKTFSFVTDPPQLFTYQPGQFVTLDLEIDEKPIKRSYSISSTPSRPHTLDITVKRVPAPSDQSGVPAGLVSNWLHDHLKIGSQIKLNGPLGKFTCFANPAPRLLFISAGSGITPMMSMSRWLCDTVCDVDITFIHSARSPRDIIFRQELELMAAKYPNFKLAITITRPEPGRSWFGYTGRLNEIMLRAIAPDFAERQVYVCGSNPFMESVKSMMQSLNFSMDNYYEESFGGANKKKSPAQTLPNTSDLSEHSFIKPSSQPRATHSFNSSSEKKVKQILETSIIPSISTKKSEPISSEMRTKSKQTSPSDREVSWSSSPIPVPAPPVSMPVILFAKSGKEISCDGEESILEVAKAENIDLPYGCQMGACGQCKLPKLEGKVAYEDDPNCEDGYVLTCVAKPVGKVVIDA
jgi:ferredoxin-NADP reductase/ferredoxin